jgi:hypothetical protein
MLRRLSTEYLNETHRAKKADAPAPWLPPEQEPLDREAIANHLDSIFGAYK